MECDHLRCDDHLTGLDLDGKFVDTVGEESLFEISWFLINFNQKSLMYKIFEWFPLDRQKGYINSNTKIVGKLQIQ